MPPDRRMWVLGVALLVVTAGILAFVGSVGAVFQQQQETASFEVSEFTAPNTTEPTENVTITATVTNPNDREDTQVVEYRFEGAVLAQELVTLGPDESTTVTFDADLSGLGSGTYVHGVFTRDTGELAEITIPGSFRVTELNAPETGTIGEPLVVNATITNPSEAASTQDVEFRLDGEVLDRQTVELGAGESTTVTFEVETNGIAPGEYFHAVLTRDFGAFARVELESGPPTGTAEATFANQTSDGTTVVIDEVTLSEGGFVAIHDERLFDGEVAESVIGVSEYLGPGTYENVTVRLFEVPGGDFDTTQLEETQTLIAMPHFDSGDNQRYDFVRTDGLLDGPYVTDDGVVIDTAVVTVGEPATPTPGTPGTVTETPGPPTDTPGNETETPGPPTDTPSNETETPGAPTETPGNETETPGEPTDTPGTETETPGNETETPGAPTETPSPPTDTLASPTDTPGSPTDTPSNGTETAPPASPTPDTATETLATTEAPENGQIPAGPLRTAFLGVVAALAVPVLRR